MSTSNEMQKNRLASISELKDMGVDPYPAAAYRTTHSINELIIASQADEAVTVRTFGRITALRLMGKAAFIDLLDEGKKLQGYLSLKTLGDRDWSIVKLLDLGDIVGIEGFMFYTRKEELTLHVQKLTLLSKAALPLPLGKVDSDGNLRQSLSDTGRLLRDRHIDLLLNNDLRQRLISRHKMMRTIRDYLDSEGFVELETPVLGRDYGGAAASPFETHLNALSADMYLRVSPECFLKRAFVGGLHKVYEIGKQFRNEGLSYKHNPEFTSLEWYEVNTDYNDQMVRFENLVERLAISVTGSPLVSFKEETIDFTAPWQRRSVIELVANYLGVSDEALTHEFLSQTWDREALKGEKPKNWGELLMGVFEGCVEGDLKGPIFVIDHPVEVSPLTKKHRSDERLVERFEPFVLGIEIGNAYSELNDPTEQRSRLTQQDNSRDEPYGVDEAFLTAIDHGMPQCGGVGIGLDRIIMILTNAERLSDVILFPTV